jgi:hypothetical protein
LKLSVWRERSLGTSRGSLIFANEMRCGVVEEVSAVLRAAKICPSTNAGGESANPPLQSATGQAISI